MTIMLLILALLVAIWWLMRKRREAADDGSQSSRRRQTTDTSYHAVSIRFSGKACAAAKEMEGRRFLAIAAPKLPLPECDNLECQCRFAHHQDRRSGDDRRSPFAHSGFGGATGRFETDKREGKERRKDPD